MKSQVIQSNKGVIEYTIQGQGPEVLVCHGTSSNCYSTGMTVPLIDAGFTVLTPSRPGYGRTPLATGRSANQAAEGMIALLDSLEIRTCSVVGVSGGGPTAIALAAGWPDRFHSLVLVSAISQPETRSQESSYKKQMDFYGPAHNLLWGMLGLISRLFPSKMAFQTMSIFSTHDPDDVIRQLTPEDIQMISQFYQNSSSRRGAVNDATHEVGKDVLQKVSIPTMVVHSREDASVPFGHAEWSLANIANSCFCESGVTGHFFWVGPDAVRIMKTMAGFIHSHLDQILP